MKENFTTTTVTKKNTYPTQQNITDATAQATIFSKNNLNMNITKYKDKSFNTYWKDYFAPYHSINCSYSKDYDIDYKTYILNHLGYNNHDNDHGSEIINYYYNIFLNNNPQIKLNLTQKYNGKTFAITDKIYYNVFVPIFKDYYPEMLSWRIALEINPITSTNFLMEFCKLSQTPLKSTKFAN
jgi:hypothetical protein